MVAPFQVHVVRRYQWTNSRECHGDLVLLQEIHDQPSLEQPIDIFKRIFGSIQHFGHFSKGKSKFSLVMRELRFHGKSKNVAFFQRRQ